MNLRAARRGLLGGLAGLGLLLATARPGLAAEPDGATLGARIDAVVGAALADQRIVGAVVVVLQDGAIIHQHAYGLADREAQRAMREDTIFRLASCTKTIVTTAALALVEQGRLGLDDPVTKWLPAFLPALADGRHPAITLRQLLTHTAGLSYPFMEGPDGPYHRERVSSGIDQPGLSMDEELARVTRAGLAFEPGTQWLYSVSIDVLGAVVSTETRMPLHEAVDALVAKPLGAASFSFTVRDQARLATPYYQAQGRLLRMNDPQDVDWPGAGPITFAPSRNLDATSFPSGGGGMSSTAIDFALLLDAIRAGGGPLLTPATARAMLANQTGDLPIVLGPGWGFGFGGAVLLDPQAAGTPQSRGTWTWSGVYGNSWFVDPARGLTVVALTNVAPEGDSGPFTLALRDAIYATAITATNSPRATP